MPRAPVENTGFKVLVARSAKSAAAKADGLPILAVLPDRRTWNDYSLQLFAKLVVIKEEGFSEPYHLRLMFEGESTTAAVLDREFKKRGPVFEITDIEASFCSLQNSVISYRALVETLGFEAAIQGLRALRDVVLARIEGEDTEAVRLSESEAFHAGMVRENQRYAALRRGGRHLRPRPVDVVEDSARSFELSAQLPGLTHSIEARFDFEPDPIFLDRACVLIGRNGVGKTQLLKAIVDGLTDEEHREADAAAEVFLKPPPSISRLLVLSSVASDPYRKSIVPWGGIDYEYLPIAAEQVPLGPKFVASLLDCLRDDGFEFGAQDVAEMRLSLLESLLRELGVWTSLLLPLRTDAEFGTFRVVSLEDRPYAPLHQGMTERQVNQFTSWVDRTAPAKILAAGSLRRLSSGEVAMVHFVAQVVASIETGSLLLLDEPETHLHPNYVTRFMDILQQLLDQTSSVAIIATHSAYVVREVPSRRVGVLQREGGATFVDQPRMQTFGARIDDLSQFVFMESDVSPRFRKRLMEWASEVGSELDLDGILELYGDQLSPVTMSLVARTIKRDRPS